MDQDHSEGDELKSFVVRRAPFRFPKTYLLTNREIDDLLRGAPTSILFRFSLVLLSISGTLIVTLASVRIDSSRLLAAYVAVAGVTLIAGLVTLVIWFSFRRSANALLKKILSPIRLKLFSDGLDPLGDIPR